MCVLGALHCYRVCTGTRAAPLQRSASPKPSTRPHSSNLGRRLKSRDGSGRNLMCYSLFSSCFSFHADSSNIQTTPASDTCAPAPTQSPRTPPRHLNSDIVDDMPHATPARGRHDLRDTCQHALGARCTHARRVKRLSTGTGV